MKMPKGPRSIRRVPESYSALAKNAFHLHKALQISLVRFLDVLGWRAKVCFTLIILFQLILYLLKMTL